MGRWRSCRQQRIALELSAYSPSDSERVFRTPVPGKIILTKKKKEETHWEEHKLQADKLRGDSLNNPFHWQIDGHRDEYKFEIKQRIMGTLTINRNLPELYAVFQAFPRVGIVTSLLIRRQFNCKAATDFLRELLRETFTCLR